MWTYCLKTGLGVGFSVPRSGKKKKKREVNESLDCYYDRKPPVILLHNIHTAVIARGAPKGVKGGGGWGPPQIEIFIINTKDWTL